MFFLKPDPEPVELAGIGWLARTLRLFPVIRLLGFVSLCKPRFVDTRRLQLCRIDA